MNLVLEVALEKRGAWESWEIERLGFGPTSDWGEVILTSFAAEQAKKGLKMLDTS